MLKSFFLYPPITTYILDQYSFHSYIFEGPHIVKANIETHTKQQIKEFCNCNTGLFEMIVGVLTISHTQYTSDMSICTFFLIEQHSRFVTYLTGALYVHPF